MNTNLNRRTQIQQLNSDVNFDSFSRRFPLRYLFFLFPVLIYLSCSKTSVSSEENIISEIVSRKSINEKRLVYSTFSDNEKIQVWLAHFREMKLLNEYSPIQLALIKEIEVMLKNNSDIFSKGLDETDEFIIWIHKTSEAFTREQVFLLFGTLEKEYPPSKLTLLKEDEKKDCSCSTKSDYCWTMDNDPPIGGWHSCEVTNCKRKDTGCGLLWMKECDGDCKLHLII